jgi:hypothetical protein
VGNNAGMITSPPPGPMVGSRVAVLLALGATLLLTAAGCASLDQSKTDFQRSRDAVDSELQVMVLICQVGQRDDPPATSLAALLTDVDTALADEHSAVSALPADQPGRTTLLDVIDEAATASAALRTAVDTADPDRIAQSADTVTDLSQRVSRLGAS